MSKSRICSVFAVGFPCVAATIQTFAPLGLFIGLIMVGMAFTLVGLIFAQREAKHAELVHKMDQAFGKPNDNQA